ncbi:MAG: energy transducer TonB [Sphingobacteriia bacterium 28-36-52]|jgi:protein TonB|uniref:energy transducer TonB n=1 Tax=Sediminibacterium sp. TaxID=1917865 RepID=UPI000BC6B755|nr:energy transducer TonB [Sediminibacterium sp.]OYW80828.1 MAG: energy transducer TonB [Sphingobacteriia bacterium 32-37-4]OYY10552.1 MAG: energy transducer TonB [Sphingobacteriia bacterium 35-36-14]OYZ02139.1 MAG: energy transducer TonB [Sphingobacteriia bacterium 28-36-52]OYZ54236.1 MAG: energy transducer TonB [Sphingobacteriia bacterium 24-36-13]OZA65659.1 MAG: energy transducer TonB [Sphingobacteriia bacterium 39-36-14]
MDVNKIQSADILDIIFDGRNKEYGAYELRKSYNKRMTKALVGTVLILLLAVLGNILANTVGKESKELIVQDVSLENVQQEEKKPEPPPPPPPPKQEPPKVEITKFTPPKIVKDEEVKEEDEIKEVEKLEDTKIGTINQEGAKDEGIVAPPVESGTGVVEAPKKEEDYDKIFTVVQIPAEFPGGLPAWAKYLERNLNRDLPVENGAPPGKYTVVVSFIVAKDGAISDVVAENDPGYGTKAEAVRVITRGPKWKPAVQNGRNVIYRHKQSITFMVSEE